MSEGEEGDMGDWGCDDIIKLQAMSSGLWKLGIIQKGGQIC